MTEVEKVVKKEFGLRAFTADFMVKELEGIRDKTRLALGTRLNLSTKGLHDRIGAAIKRLKEDK